MGKKGSKNPPVRVRRDADGDKTVELSRSSITKLDDLQQSGPRPCLITIAGPAIGRLFELSRATMVMGRSPEVDVVLVDDGISRRHARIDRTDDQYLLIDLGSTNGIFVNGDKVSEQLLKDGDRIRIGSSTVLKFSLQDALEENFQKRMYDSAVRDSLTEIYNKRYFRDSLSTEFAYYTRHNLELSVIMLDIDHFKKINDTHGHVAGDFILKTVAKLIGEALRTEDILCRYGGEEFAVILRSTGAEEALLVAERIRKKIAGFSFEHGDATIPTTISLGVATLKDGNYPSAIHLVRGADKFLYAAKEAGRNRTACAPTGKRMKARTEHL